MTTSLINRYLPHFIGYVTTVAWVFELAQGSGKNYWQSYHLQFKIPQPRRTAQAQR